jgi:alanine racemase
MRIGFPPDDRTLEIISRMARLPGISLEGIYTHFASADCDQEFAREQFMKFQCFLKKLAAAHIYIRWRHCANSAAMIDMPYTALDMVRAGIILYGYYPSKDADRKLQLQPVMSLKARVAFVKDVPPGASISYGRKYFTDSATRIATIPLGYADGYLRALSNRAEVLIHGQRAPVVGTVCMDQLMVDVGRIPGVLQGDEAVIMGRQGDQEITADDLAAKLGTISYEVLCTISERVPRVYVGGGQD